MRNFLLKCWIMYAQTVKLKAHARFTMMWHMLRDKMTSPVPSAHGCQFGFFDRFSIAFESVVVSDQSACVLL